MVDQTLGELILRRLIANALILVCTLQRVATLVPAKMGSAKSVAPKKAAAEWQTSRAGELTFIRCRKSNLPGTTSMKRVQWTGDVLEGYRGHPRSAVDLVGQGPDSWASGAVLFFHEGTLRMRECLIRRAAHALL